MPNSRIHLISIALSASPETATEFVGRQKRMRTTLRLHTMPSNKTEFSVATLESTKVAKNPACISSLVTLPHTHFMFPIVHPEPTLAKRGAWAPWAQYACPCLIAAWFIKYRRLSPFPGSHGSFFLFVFVFATWKANIKKGF